MFSSVLSKIKKKKRQIIIITISVIVALCFVGGCYYAYKYNEYYNIEPVTEDILQDAGIEGFNNLVIVAHPDDEVLWAGAHMAEAGYFVVCVTSGNNETRSKEFNEVLKAFDNKGIILSYPNKTFGERDDWTKVEDQLIDDLTTIIEHNNWDIIVTHNPKGEYGHQHHVMLNRYVTDIYNKLEKKGDLYYFGKYYKAKDVEEAMKGKEGVSKESLKKKEEVLKLYKSQEKIINNLSHMNQYEEWTLYSGK